MRRASRRLPAVLLLGAFAVGVATTVAASTELDRQIDRLGAARDVRAQAREALAAAGSEAVPALIERIEDARFTVRWEVVNLLGVIRDPYAVAPLVGRALEDDNAHVRWRSLWALRTINDPSIPDRLAEGLGGDDAVRWNAAVALSMFGDPRSLDLVTEMISSRDPWVRWEAVNALGRVHDEDSSSRLLDLLDHPHLRTRQEVVMSLGRIGDETAVKGLIQALEDPHPQVRWRAAMGLSRVEGDEVDAVLDAKRDLERDPQVQRHLHRALSGRSSP